MSWKVLWIENHGKLKWLLAKYKSDLFRFAFWEYRLSCNAKNRLEKARGDAERWVYELLQLSRQDAMVTWINNTYVFLLCYFLIYQIFCCINSYSILWHFFTSVFSYHFNIIFSLNFPYHWAVGFGFFCNIRHALCLLNFKNFRTIFDL